MGQKMENKVRGKDGDGRLKRSQSRINPPPPPSIFDQNQIVSSFVTTLGIYYHYSAKDSR